MEIRKNLDSWLLVLGSKKNEFMKIFLWIAFVGLCLSVSMTSCGDAQTYARELERERALIDDFISRQNITVVNRMPTEEEFLADTTLFFRSSSGLFFRLDEPTNRPLSDTIVPGDRLLIYARWIEYTLTTRPDTMDFRSMPNFPHGFTFSNVPPSTAPAAFLEAVRYMRGSGARARLIVPHRIGWNPLGAAIPFGYDLEIRFRRDADFTELSTSE
jgi:hypothetical protein